MAGPRSPAERLTIGPAERVLEAAIDVPPGPPRGGAVVAHPHPEYGGTMDNGVVVAVGDALAGVGLAVLRFNFGGVGRSAGRFTGGPGEIGDVRTALDALAEHLPADLPLALVGYSFGAWAALGVACAATERLRHVVAVGPPLAFLDWSCLGTLTVPATFVVGDRDQFCPQERLRAALEADGARITCRTIAGGDHFLAGREREVGAVVADALRDLV